MGKIYFASDFHLGINARVTSKERQQQVIRWLDSIAPDAEAIYLVGDIFDFWFEYKTVVPKGYTRFLGKLAEISDAGVEMHFFTGNHDMWIFRYFEDELGITTHRKPVIHQHKGKTFFIGHGDGLGPGDRMFKITKKIFANPLCQWLFERLHPNFGIGLGNYWSGKSRKANPALEQFLGPDGEWLLQYANRKLDTVEADYFIFGHRHLPIDCTLKNGVSRYINLGEWLHYNSYAEYDGNEVTLRFFEYGEGRIFGR